MSRWAWQRWERDRGLAVSLFGRTGAGQLFVEAARAGDTGMAVAALAGLCGLAVLLGALGGALHGRIDPRVRMA
ncbi:hypothetical protein [Azospirillum sp. Marseille-Q6669]